VGNPRTVEIAILNNIYETFKQKVFNELAEAGRKTEITKFLD